MLRRAVLGCGLCLLATACLRDEPVMSPTLRSSSAPVGRIRRLLVWLPGDETAGKGNTEIRSAAIERELRVRGGPLDIVVRVETVQALELDRAETQRQVIADFKPTHRLEIDRGVKGPRPDPTLGIPYLPGFLVGSIMQNKVSNAYFTVALYVADSREPIRVYRYGPAYKANELVDSIVAELKADGFL
jgi:hypothetical protein